MAGKIRLRELRGRRQIFRHVRLKSSGSVKSQGKLILSEPFFDAIVQNNICQCAECLGAISRPTLVIAGLARGPSSVPAQ